MSKYKYSREQLLEIIEQLETDWARAELLRKSGLDKQGVDLTIPFANLKRYCLEKK